MQIHQFTTKKWINQRYAYAELIHLEILCLGTGEGALNFCLALYGMEHQNGGLKNLLSLQKWGTENFQHFESLGTEIWAKFTLQSWKFLIFFYKFIS